MMNYKIKEATLKDIKTLKSIADSWEDHERVTGEAFEDNYFETCVTKGDLPPIENASKANNKLHLVSLHDEPIALFDSYYGYPNNKSVWISLFVIDKNKRKQGHGKQIIKLIETSIDKNKCDDISIAVDLKNYSGLKFWTKIGFKEVIGVFGDNTYSENNYAMIALKRSLS